MISQNLVLNANECAVQFVDISKTANTVDHTVVDTLQSHGLDDSAVTCLGTFLNRSQSNFLMTGKIFL